MKLAPFAPTLGDTGTLCQFSSGRAAGGIWDPAFPDVAEQYLAFPGPWLDSYSVRVPDPDAVFVMWREIPPGYEILELHELTDPWEMARRCVDAGRPLIVWTYLYDAWDREYLHSELLVGITPTWVQLWEQQRQNWHGAAFSDFVEGRGPVRWAGRLYLLQPAGTGYPEEAPLDNRAIYEPLAQRIAGELEIDPDLFCRQIQQESGWDPFAVSRSGAEGLGQLMPKFYPHVRRFEPEANLRAAAETMRANLDLFTGDYAAALAAYNGGKVGVMSWIAAHPGDWRRALTDRADDWPAVWGGPAKARQVAAYLDAILGPQEDPTVNPPPTIWIGSPNYAPGRRNQRPVAIVNHVAEGTLAGCDSWFRNPASQVSAHFCVGKSGEIHQYVKLGDTAWANGRVNRPDRSIGWLVDAINGGINPNMLTVSIEREGRSGDPIPEPQYQSILALHRWLCSDWGIPIDREHIIGHRSIDSVDRPNCPGPQFPWDRLMADLLGTGQAHQITRTAALDEIWRIAGLIEATYPAESDTLRRMVIAAKDAA